MVLLLGLSIIAKARTHSWESARLCTTCPLIKKPPGFLPSFSRQKILHFKENRESKTRKLLRKGLLYARLAWSVLLTYLSTLSTYSVNWPFKPL